MKLFFIEPEVAGGHGNQSIYGTEQDILTDGISGRIKFLHYEFQGWLGDDLLEATPAFIVSHKLKAELMSSTFTDFKLEECQITVSDALKELDYAKKIPPFTRLIPFGKIRIDGERFENWSGHHFCMSSKGELVVTQEALDLLKRVSLNHCDIIPLEQM
ncbi:hypothetical protein ACK1LH_19385 [Metabacillus indicus]|uniref:hypothetical protein n=1 Tax=Metabacillus indicus TaxID=246786 RepID=UPI00398454D9